MIIFRVRRRLIGCIAISAGLLQGTSWSQDPPVWESLAIYPPATHLSSTSDLQHIVVVATRKDGVTSDVTDQAEYALSDPALASWNDHTLRPLADGNAQLKVTWNGMTAESPIVVTQATATREISFTSDVMPILTRASCNTGSCHGAARGKDGFRLSLFGFDPKGDYTRITREIGIRRINLAIPDQSLFLLKATGAVQHSGGKRIEPAANTTKHF